MTYNKRNNLYIHLFLFLAFFMFGFSENVKGPAIPKIQFDFSLNEMQVGLLLSLNSLGYLLACAFTGKISKLLGIKTTSFISLFVMAISGILICFSHSYPILSLSFFILYLGNGMLEIVLAIVASTAFTSNTGFRMNLFHGFYGLSSIFAPLVATSLMTVNFNLPININGWRIMYMIMLLLSLIPLIPMFSSSLTVKKKTSNSISLRSYIKDPVSWIILAILSFGVIAELAVGGWLCNFLEKCYGYTGIRSSGFLSGFFILFMLSRIFLGAFTDKIGYSLSICVFTLFSAVCTFIGVFCGEPAAFFLALSGAGIAIVYPTVMALLVKRNGDDNEIPIAFSVTGMGIAVVAGNYLIGFLTDIFRESYGVLIGYKTGYSFIGLCALLCSAFAFYLYKKRI